MAPPAGPPPRRQAHPAPRGGRGRRGRIRGLRGLPPTGGRSGQRCGERPGWTPPAASPDPPTPGSGSAGGARPGAGGRSWTWPQPSASSPGPGATISRPRRPAAQARQGRPRGHRQRHRAHLSWLHRLRADFDPPHFSKAKRAAAAEGRWSSSLNPTTLVASEGSIRRRSQAMRPDLALSLAPAPRTFLQTADVASCGRTALPSHHVQA